MKSLQGHLLVASPHLPDPNFARTVVLIVKHSDEGAMGLVLNRPSEHQLREVWEQLSEMPETGRLPINVGGPLEGPLMAVHAASSCSEDEILPGIHFATHRDQLTEIVSQTDFPFRIFNGYAGWAAGQLDAEMDVGGWLTIRATSDYLFATPSDELWKRVVFDIGDEILASSLGIDDFPDDPSLN